MYFIYFEYGFKTDNLYYFGFTFNITLLRLTTVHEIIIRFSQFSLNLVLIVIDKKR
ncbi:hypothetical protein C1645_765082 [Glomus cerebriforme]|uniref:Uncharacterized protein n=1 Tax=Glomus cerebriforme TaxID=658196 RepID=A0A397T7X1_9GLOM|nr:hypothetical protein C1645_765082 [Glomus cerebriforme]